MLEEKRNNIGRNISSISLVTIFTPKKHEASHQTSPKFKDLFFIPINVSCEILGRLVASSSKRREISAEISVIFRD